MNAIIFLLATGVQAAASFLLVLFDPSEDQNVFLLGYSLSRLLFGAVFLIILAFCLYGVAAVLTQKTSLLVSLRKKMEQPGRLALIFIGLLVFNLISAAFLMIANSFATGTKIQYYSRLSVESLALNIQSILSPVQAYWIELIPLFKWCLLFGINALIYIIWIGICGKKTQFGKTLKRKQEFLASGLSLLLIIIATLIVYFPTNQSPFFQLSRNSDWLIVFAIIACLGLLVLLLNYHTRSLQFFMWGVLILGVMFNLVDHSYSTIQKALVQKPDYTLESLANSRSGLYGPYAIYHSLSKEYSGKEIQINQEIMDQYLLSQDRLITMGRLSRVTILDDEMILNAESADQLEKLPNVQITLPLESSDNPVETIWVFVTPEVDDYAVVQIRQTKTGKIFVIPVTPETLFSGKSK